MAHPPHPVTTMLDTIGSTPVTQLNHIVPEGAGKVFVKLEYFNPTGSYKDRMAKTMISEAERRGTLKPGMTVVEASGGSTGSSLAFVCAVRGYKFHVVSSNAFAQEKLRTIAAFGAEVELIHSPSGKITADLIPSMIARARDLGAQDGWLYTDQFDNEDSLAGYETLGQELVEQFPDGITAFCGAAGIGGMLIGAAKALKAADPATRIVLLEPESSPTITQGKPGTHHVEGIGIGFVPPLLETHRVYDEARGISESEARAMCRRLASEEGIFAGTSTGINVVAAIALAQELGPDATVVTVACDSGLKYTNGTLYNQAPD
ncbi:PLP-dependent cysteine synthase family protein [Alloyangia pacifica]|uniref:Cysteine synthase n=1 Tax=Alloyangia pacifica TaxID=311180 RepID=A0A1I6UPU2_9RHOB|nr:cysteine synthase family protein [Alloyangia pacifica]SDH77707.1 Cysteine synthase [Alloyangia pacifica]SFT03449.1 Cysteine synthase [Alloyangia pacifica]